MTSQNPLKTFSSSDSAPAHATCGACRDGIEPPMEFSMAFQPIVDVSRRRVVAYEALVRGPQNQGARFILDRVNDTNRYAFDQSCRVRAIRLAAQLGLAQTGASLSVNFLPGAVYSPAACIRKTLETAAECSFPLSHLIFELIEVEQVRDTSHLHAIAAEYRRHGFTLALDDFGAGFSGLNLLAELDVQKIKLDARLVRDVDTDLRKRQIICKVVELCTALGVAVVAEAVETVGEYEVLRACGITLMQGYLLARPAFEALPEVHWPDLAGLPTPMRQAVGIRPAEKVAAA